jgi:hypothetical protein
MFIRLVGSDTRESARATPTEPEMVRIQQVQAAALRYAAQIAAAQASPLAAVPWNSACQRVQSLIEAEADKIDGHSTIAN